MRSEKRCDKKIGDKLYCENDFQDLKNFQKLLTNKNRGSIISTKLNSKGYDEDGKAKKLSESRGGCDPDSGML